MIILTTVRPFSWHKIACLTLSKSYIPDVETEDELYVVEHQDVELVGASLTSISNTLYRVQVLNRVLDIPTTERTPAKHPALLSLSVGIPPSKKKPSLFKRMTNKRAMKALMDYREEQPKSQILQLPLHEFKARGWDATTEKWRMPVFPTLNETLGRAPKNSSAHIWNLEVADMSDPNLTKSKGKQRDPGEP
jgi:hypothetical protein